MAVLRRLAGVAKDTPSVPKKGKSSSDVVLGGIGSSRSGSGLVVEGSTYYPRVLMDCPDVNK